MKGSQPLIFWQPNISPHTMPVLRHLASRRPVTLCVVEHQSSRRKEMGWTLPDVGNVKIMTIDGDVRAFFTTIHTPEAIHLFSGTRAYPILWKALHCAIRQKAKVGIVSEPQDWTGLKGWLRWLIARWDTWQLQKGISFILAIGHRGEWWFRKIGYDDSKVFPWGYFVDENNSNSMSASPGPAVQFVYVGRLIEIKGVHDMVDAFLKLEPGRFKLHIVGDGPLRDELQQKAKTGNRPDITFHGNVGMNEVNKFFNTADYLILPSTGKDGWGVVVNEALHAGVPCIVSKNTGASSLLSDSLVGRDFDAHQNGSLFDIVSSIVKEGKKTSIETRQWIQRFAHGFSASEMSRHLEAVVDYVFKREGARPIAPWRKNQKQTP